MYVCICHQVNERAVQQAVDSGARNVEELRLALGVGDCCGACIDYAETLLSEALKAGPQRSAPVI